MKVHEVERIAGALLLEPAPTSMSEASSAGPSTPRLPRDAGIDPDAFAQDSLSRSVQGVVRGLHVRSGAGETKLVRCSSGAVFDVIVDLRPSSPTYRNWQSFELDGDGQQSVYIPNGCAHGFQALTSVADVSYRIDRPHDPSEDIALRFDDPDLAIPWPLPVGIVSPRDQQALSLEDAAAACGDPGKVLCGRDERLIRERHP